MRVESQKGPAPAETSLPDLMKHRDWLFDTSRLTSVIAYCLETSDTGTLRLPDELCVYGCRLSPNFACKGQPLFGDGYVDFAHHVKAVRGADAEPHTPHFHRKALDPLLASRMHPRS